MRLPGHRRTQRIALGLAAAAIVVVSLRSHSTSLHKAAPALPAKALQGTPVTVASLHGHPTALVFWASWCTDCHVEAAAIERFARSPAGSGRVVGVDTSDGGDWRSFVHHYHWSFPILADPNGTTLAAYGLTVSLPVTVVIDAKGRIAAVRYGAQTVATLQRALAAA